MPPIVSIVGRSESGKTRLLRRLIPEMKRRGYRIATIKHTHHCIESDIIGKDSWLHAAAGSECTVLDSPNELSLRYSPDQEITPEEVSRFIPEDFDLILAEGYKKADLPKIEVHRDCLGERVCPGEKLLAIVTDTIQIDPIPQYDPDDVIAIADLIESEVLNRQAELEVNLFADGQRIPLNDFVKGFMGGSILGMLDSLKGIDDPKSISIEITKKTAPRPVSNRGIEIPEGEILRTFV